MMNREDIGDIIDKHMLQFLDDYAYTFGSLPSKEIVNAWMSGFVASCRALTDAMLETKDTV